MKGPLIAIAFMISGSALTQVSAQEVSNKGWLRK